MAHMSVKADDRLQPEYSVYIYHWPENQHEGQNDWEMRTLTHDLKAAMHEAMSLYNSQSFRKVEIKECALNPRTEQLHAKTLKIYSEGEPAFSMPTALKAFGVVAVASLVSLCLLLML